MLEAHPGQESYPDLKKPIPLQDISLTTTAEVHDGFVYFRDKGDQDLIVISEWDLGNFIADWLVARLDERPYMAEKAEIR